MFHYSDALPRYLAVPRRIIVRSTNPLMVPDTIDANAIEESFAKESADFIEPVRSGVDRTSMMLNEAAEREQTAARLRVSH